MACWPPPFTAVHQGRGPDGGLCDHQHRPVLRRNRGGGETRCAAPPLLPTPLSTRLSTPLSMLLSTPLSTHLVGLGLVMHLVGKGAPCVHEQLDEQLSTRGPVMPHYLSVYATSSFVRVSSERECEQKYEMREKDRARETALACCASTALLPKTDGFSLRCCHRVVRAGRDLVLYVADVPYDIRDHRQRP